MSPLNFVVAIGTRYVRTLLCFTTIGSTVHSERRAQSAHNLRSDRRRNKQLKAMCGHDAAVNLQYVQYRTVRSRK